MPHSPIIIDNTLMDMQGNATKGSIHELHDLYTTAETWLESQTGEAEEMHEVLEELQEWAAIESIDRATDFITRIQEIME